MSIFDIEVRIDIIKEFKKMVNYLHLLPKTTVYGDYYCSFIHSMDYAIKKWPYRGTAINCGEYLDNIGIPSYSFDSPIEIDRTHFLYYIEFIYNIYNFAIQDGSCFIHDENVMAIINNMDFIAEKLNYKFAEAEDKYLLVKRDSNVDSVLGFVRNDIATNLLEYNDFKIHDDVLRKGELLKNIDKYIEANQSELKKLDKDSLSTLGYISNNIGINHRINEKYKDISKKELLAWYDKYFILAIHLIRLSEVDKINNERKKINGQEQ